MISLSSQKHYEFKYFLSKREFRINRCKIVLLHQAFCTRLVFIRTELVFERVAKLYCAKSAKYSYEPVILAVLASAKNCFTPTLEKGHIFVLSTMCII